MRMGKLGKRERIGKGYPTGSTKPQRTAKGTVVGSVSGNLINSVYLPLFQENAKDALESYLMAQIEYDDALAAMAAAKDSGADDDTEGEEQASAEGVVNADGSIQIDPIASIPENLTEPVPPVFPTQIAIDDFTETMEEIAKHFSKGGGWKIHANAAKF